VLDKNTSHTKSETAVCKFGDQLTM